MKNIGLALHRHASYLRRYPVTFILVIACCGIILFTSYHDKNFVHAIGYIACAWFCCLLTDIVIYTWPKDTMALPVKRSARGELLTIVVCTILGFAFLCIRFFTDWAHIPSLIKLAFLPLILFTFPVVLALLYLFRYKYKPRELGVNVNYWFLPIILHIVWGGVTLWVAPEKSHFQEGLKEYGFWGFLFTGIVTAAIPEEFVRMLFQTRLGKVLNAPAFGFFMATVIWGAMHIPVGYNQDHVPVTFFSAIEGISYLMPIGMFWGYLTYRTRSMFSAVAMHSFNLWGLQNF